MNTPILNASNLHSWITVEVPHWPPVRVPLGTDWSVGREGACLDICLSRAVDLATGLAIEISITTDGTVRWMRTTPEKAGLYWHFSRELTGQSPARPPTSAQRRVLAEIWLGMHEPFGLSGLGAPVCEWAFAGTTPDALAAEFGRPTPALNGLEIHAAEPIVDRTPYHKGDDVQ